MASVEDSPNGGLCFYHATDKLYVPDDVIRPRRRRMVRTNPRGVVDRLFEEGRRGNNVCRNRALFLIGLPQGVDVSHGHFARSGANFPDGHVYRVQPHSQATMHDRRWVDELQARHAPLVGGKIAPSVRPNPDLKALTDAEIAECYWLGKSTDKPEWEYVTDQATVLQRVVERVITAFDAEFFEVSVVPRAEKR